MPGRNHLRTLPQPLLRSLDVADLRSLVTAADAGSVGRAAIRLRISQPALSKRLQAVEQVVGVPLLERSQSGVTLTPAGRLLYEQARPLLAQADLLDTVVAQLRRSVSPVRVAASHSAAEAFVRDALSVSHEEAGAAAELVMANSHVVRTLVADGRADVGVAPVRPSTTPHTGVRRRSLADDEIVCAVPHSHVWAQRPHIRVAEFLATRMVLRDPASNARATVEYELRRRGLTAAAPLVLASTPDAARREAIKLGAPLMLSRHVLDPGFFAEVTIEGLSFPRSYELLLPVSGEPNAATRAVIGRIEAAVAAW
jgi:DNA-binding transcriptional LysR family regulator